MRYEKKTQIVAEIVNNYNWWTYLEDTDALITL